MAKNGNELTDEDKKTLSINARAMNYMFGNGNDEFN